jgi:hypothetical protein
MYLFKYVSRYLGILVSRYLMCPFISALVEVREARSASYDFETRYFVLTV